jgi:hypothetical protein
MFSESRNWKWMVPSTLIPVMIIIWGKMMAAGWTDLAILPAGLLIICCVASLINMIIYAYEHFASIYADVRAVTNATPEVRMFEAAKGMHPDAVKALLVHRRSIWRIKYIPLKDVVDWIFDEMPTVHAGFVDFVLDHSSNVALMSKRLLSEGSKQFDPEELTTDYEQYDALIGFLQVHLMCTQALGNQSPQWLPPWSVDLVRHRFGLDGAPYAVEEGGMSEAMKSVMRAQAQWKNNGLKDLGSTQQTARPDGQSSQLSAVSSQKEKAESEERKMEGKEQDEIKPLTTEELDAINKEMALNASKYRQ